VEFRTDSGRGCHGARTNGVEFLVWQESCHRDEFEKRVKPTYIPVRVTVGAAAKG
jgi:hypothetical protein